MASGWNYEYRVWRTWRADDGTEDADLATFQTLGDARTAWSGWAARNWLPAGTSRGTVSGVLIFRRPSGGGVWSPFGTVEGTSDCHVGWNYDSETA